MESELESRNEPGRWPDPSCAPRTLTSALLPVARRTLRAGRGPPWMLSLAWSLGIDHDPRTAWTSDDERSASVLARAAARLLVAPGQAWPSGYARHETLVELLPPSATTAGS